MGVHDYPVYSSVSVFTVSFCLELKRLTPGKNLFDEAAKKDQSLPKSGLMARDEGLLQKVNYKDFP